MNQSQLKVALIGYGKMGRLIDEIAAGQNSEVTARIHPQNSSHSFEMLDRHTVDVCIDFSHPDAVVHNVKAAADKGLNMVMGTTGWHSHQERVRDIVANGGIGFLHAPNFSIGVNLYLKILKEMTAIMNAQSAYDAAVNEVHHNQKVDIPSGTAHAIAEVVLDGLDRKKRVLCTQDNGCITESDLHVSSLRCGNIPGTHTVTFDSADDTITLTHTARNREGFAKGALTAAHWLHGKQGFFTMDDLL